MFWREKYETCAYFSGISEEIVKISVSLERVIFRLTFPVGYFLSIRQYFLQRFGQDAQNKVDKSTEMRYYM